MSRSTGALFGMGAGVICVLFVLAAPAAALILGTWSQGVPSSMFWAGIDHGALAPLARAFGGWLLAGLFTGASIAVFALGFIWSVSHRLMAPILIAAPAVAGLSLLAGGGGLIVQRDLHTASLDVLLTGAGLALAGAATAAGFEIKCRRTARRVTQARPG